MKKSVLLPVFTIVMLCMTGCSSEDENEKGVLSFFSQSGCKTTVSRGSDDVSTLSEQFGNEVVAYKGTDDGSLLISHTNAVFSCDVSIKPTVKIDDDIISIIESYKPETNCVCCYDLLMKVGPLKEGRYRVFIYNDSSDGTVAPSEPYASFLIDYNTQVKGEYFLSK